MPFFLLAFQVLLLTGTAQAAPLLAAPAVSPSARDTSTPSPSSLPAPSSSSSSAPGSLAAAAPAHPSKPAAADAQSLLWRYRASGMPADRAAALAAVAAALHAEPGQRAARHVRAELAYREDRFDDALIDAEWLNRSAPDHVEPYALLVEIYLALGRYADAERAAQWALDLRPDNPSGYRAAARVREAHGDITGAIDFIEKTYQRVPELQTTERAELLVDLARLYRLDRSLDTAAANLAAVDARAPGFFAAEIERAELHEARGEFAAAASVWGAHYRHTGALAARYREADAWRRAGQEAEAKDAFADFVRQALAAQATPANVNLELAEYYAEVAAVPADALRLARLAAAQRDTAAAQATLAWALFLNRDLEAADAALQRALGVNPDQALWRFRAGRIALARNLPDLAYAHLEAALALAPRAAFARQARKLLADIEQSQPAP